MKSAFCFILVQNTPTPVQRPHQLQPPARPCRAPFSHASAQLPCGRRRAKFRCAGWLGLLDLHC